MWASYLTVAGYNTRSLLGSEDSDWLDKPISYFVVEQIIVTRKCDGQTNILKNAGCQFKTKDVV